MARRLQSDPVVIGPLIRCLGVSAVTIVVGIASARAGRLTHEAPLPPAFAGYRKVQERNHRSRRGPWFRSLSAASGASWRWRAAGGIDARFDERREDIAFGAVLTKRFSTRYTLIDFVVQELAKNIRDHVVSRDTDAEVRIALQHLHDGAHPGFRVQTWNTGPPIDLDAVLHGGTRQTTAPRARRDVIRGHFLRGLVKLAQDVPGIAVSLASDGHGLLLWRDEHGPQSRRFEAQTGETSVSVSVLDATAAGLTR